MQKRKHQNKGLSDDEMQTALEETTPQDSRRRKGGTGRTCSFVNVKINLVCEQTRT